MSISAGGFLCLSSNELTVNDCVSLSFRLLELSVKYKIGLVLGGNARFREIRLNDTARRIRFDLTDDPLDPNAECLFSGDNVEIIVGNVRIDKGESLYSRMERLQAFFLDILSKICYK